MNAFNREVGFLNPATTEQTFVFTGLSALAFVLFVAVLVLLARNLLKLYADQRSRVLGSRLRTRMLTGAILVSLVPLAFMFFFSYGLMNRESMPSDRGMIFVFGDEQNLEFYMKNTLIPLDIVYLDRVGKVVSVAQMKPMDESAIPSGWPAKYAIELNEGTAAKVGVKAGDVIRIPAEAR